MKRGKLVSIPVITSIAKPRQVPDNSSPVPYSEALRVWIRVALLSFGGPAAQIAIMHRILVEEKRWLSESRFLHALNFCMMLPGPEAQQLATYTGWLLHGYRGGLTAGILFVLPGFIAILILSVLYALHSELAWVDALFFGLKAAVLAVVIEAVFRIGRRALLGTTHVVIAGAAFVGIFFLQIPFPAIIVSAALLGLIAARFIPEFGQPPVTAQNTASGVAAVDRMLDEQRPAHTLPTRLRTITILAIFLPLWFAPLVAIALTAGLDSVWFKEGWFFSKAAVVTFGGAYAVLAYIAQQAVEVYGWLLPGEMLDGLGMAETTPGPLIQVVQFVGFMGAFREAGDLPPLLAGTLGAILTTWVTFVPCFLWIFLGAPYVESLRGHRRLTAVMSAITAAVVGVILNLALWFALHVIFADIRELHAGPIRLLLPEAGSLDPVAALLCIGALVAMLRFGIGMLPTLFTCMALGIIIHMTL